MSRYPYTEANDALRQQTIDPHDARGPLTPCELSRVQASKIRQYIAHAIGMDDDQLARKIADYARREQS